MFGKISESQLEGIEAILKEWERRNIADPRYLTYILATTYWETAKTMQPIEEYKKGRGKKYGIPDPVTGKVYYGRGFVQLTWAWNYKKLGELVNRDLYLHPEEALELPVATEILFEGMIKGSFTGRKLSDFFNNQITDPVNARRIINGLDKAETISTIYYRFYYALISLPTTES